MSLPLAPRGKSAAKVLERSPMSDTVLRAMDDDGSFRVIAATTTETVRGAAKAQRVRGTTASYFGEILTGAALIRETMAPQMRVQSILRGADNSGTMVADSHPDGSTRGLVQGSARDRGLVFGAGARFQMMRTMRNGGIQQGIVEYHGGGFSSVLMEYLQNSEQISSVIAVATLLERDEIAVAGGYVVQLLPEAKPEAVATMNERLSALPSIESLLTAGRASPAELVDALFAGTKYTRLDETPLFFGCQCSQEKLLAALGTIDQGELHAMVDEGKDIDITCDYCGQAYVLTLPELRALLKSE